MMSLLGFSSLGRRIRAFAAIACILLASAALLRAQRLPGNVIPSHYAIALTPDLPSATFTGSESIDIQILHPTSTITLNAAQLQFKSVSIRDSSGAEQTASVTLDATRQQATFAFAHALPAGKATLQIHFTGILNHELRGFYLSQTQRRNYAVTQFEATDARRAFPCFDEPAMKATFDIRLTIDQADTAISNSPIISDTPGPGAGKHTLTFATTPRMSTYLVAFLVGDFQCTSGTSDGVQLRVCATPDKVALTPYALSVAQFALHYYDNYFAIHFPLKKLDFIAIPDFEAGAMENFGAITFRETDLLVDPKTASLTTLKNATLAIVHEMAHQWFGDLVTMQWWDNIWLNEGFATWMENKCTAAMHPEWEIPQDVAADEQNTLDLDALPTTRAIRARADTPDEINQMFDGIAYNKASDVLLMVEHYLGEETFRQGVHAYLAAHAYGNATAEDFWNALTAVSHKPVDKIMASLVEQPGEAVLSFAPPNQSSVAVTQQRFFLDPTVPVDPQQKWTLPVCFRISAEQDRCEVLTPQSTTLPVPAAQPFFANAGGKGYYRTSYSPNEYRTLVAQAETTLSPEERISLTGDEWARVVHGSDPVGNFLNLAAALAADPSNAVLSTATSKLGVIANRLASTPDERTALAAWIRQTFLPAYNRLGSPSPTDSPNQRQLRATLFAILASEGEEKTLRLQARQIAEEYLNNPLAVDPTLGQTALGIAAENGDTALFDQLQKIYETATDPERQELALRELAVFRNPALLERALEYAISPKVRNQDSAIQFAIAMSIPQNRDQTWRFIQTHWEQIRTEFTPEMGAIFVSSTGNFCSAQAQDEVKNFFASHPVPSSSTSLRHALERIRGCVELRQLQEANLKSWLAAQAHPTQQGN